MNITIQVIKNFFRPNTPLNQATEGKIIPLDDNDIEKFVQEILNIGNDFSYNRLINFAKELIIDIQTFDIEIIERKLKNMNKFINEIEKITVD